MRKLAEVSFATLAVGLVSSAVTSAPAYALTNVGTIGGVETRCNNSPYYLCLYYNSGMTTSWWGTSVAVRDLKGQTFSHGGAGDGSPVKNNAAAVSCDAGSTSICYVFYNHDFSGPTDWLYGQHSGKLVETYNQDASVKISFGA